MKSAALLISNTSWSVFNFRQNLLNLVRRTNGRVLVCAAPDAYSPDISRSYRFIGLRSLESHGTNPFRDIRLLLDLISVFRTIRPRVVLTFTIKPNIYGALAGRITGVRVVCTVNGLGRATASRTPLGAVTRFLYKISVRHASMVVFQNQEDLDWMVEKRLVRRHITALTPGSGIDLERFRQRPIQKRSGAGDFLMCGRLLKSKGVELFVAAARRARADFPDAQFLLLGPLGDEDDDGIGRGAIERWVSEGTVRYLGESKDVRPYIAAAHVVVLPTYYPEGVPRVLIEALATGRPVITTDEPGCRDTVDAGRNGSLVRSKDLESLVDAIRAHILMDSGDFQRMCEHSRRKAELQFDERIVLQTYEDLILEKV